MNRTTLTRVVVTVPCAMLFALPGVASAQQTKKLSYEQAWAQCKQEIGKNVPNESTTTAARHSAGGACMHKYGFRLKKSSSL